MTKALENQDVLGHGGLNRKTQVSNCISSGIKISKKKGRHGTQCCTGGPREGENPVEPKERSSCEGLLTKTTRRSSVETESLASV